VLFISQLAQVHC